MDKKTFRYDEIKLVSFKVFKAECLSFFKKYFGEKNYMYSSYTHYYCGDGTHSFTIISKETSDCVFDIVQNDYYAEYYFSVYDGDKIFEYDESKDYRFSSLDECFNFIKNKIEK